MALQKLIMSMELLLKTVNKKKPLKITKRNFCKLEAVVLCINLTAYLMQIILLRKINTMK